MRIAAGILMIIAGLIVVTLLRAILGSAGFLGWFIGSLLIIGGIAIMRKKS